MIYFITADKENASLISMYSSMMLCTMLHNFLALCQWVHACMYEYVSVLQTFVWACVCLFVHVRAWVKAGERLSTNRIDGFFRQACSHAFMHVYVCVIEQVDRCEGWLLAQRSVGRSMQSKLKPVGTASSMESAPTYTRYNTYVLYNLIMVLDLDVCCVFRIVM